MDFTIDHPSLFVAAIAGGALIGMFLAAAIDGRRRVPKEPRPLEWSPAALVEAHCKIGRLDRLVLAKDKEIRELREELRSPAVRSARRTQIAAATDA